MPLDNTFLLDIFRYPEEENTWEPSEHLDCQELIQEFEKKRAAKAAARKEVDKRKAGSSSSSSDAKKRKEYEEKPRGFDRNLDPERIIGTTDFSGLFTDAYLFC